jgi:hypothetical protein
MATDLQRVPAMPKLGSKRHSAQPGPTQVKQQRFAQPAHDLKQTQPPVGATAGTTVAMRPVHPAHLCKLNLRNRQRRNLRKLPQVLCMATEIQCEPAMPNLGSKRHSAQQDPVRVKQRFDQRAHNQMANTAPLWEQPEARRSRWGRDIQPITRGKHRPPVGATGGTTVAMGPEHPAHNQRQTQPPVGATGGTTVAMGPGHSAHNLWQV